MGDIPTRLAAAITRMDDIQLKQIWLWSESGQEALRQLRQIGCTEENLDSMLLHLREYGVTIASEAARRGIHFIDKSLTH